MAKRKKKIKLDELPGQPDPKAPIDGAVLLSECQAMLKKLEVDLDARAAESAAVTAALKKRHAEERAKGRTADGFGAWKSTLMTQVGAAWILSCVFARILEDRGLLGHPRIAGPGAEDSQKQFFALAPSLTERDYLLMVFRELSRLPGLRDVFDTRHNPVWKLAPSAAAARELIGLFRRPSTSEPALRFGQESTRFLGDLYQDLSETVRKKYALLQTPDFIESFILDRTLERAIERFGLEDTDLIDPTCGSGHFLLGAFERLFEHRLRAQPGLDPREAARLALDKVYGADINAYAVAIARFRLTLAFIDKAGYKTLTEVPELPLQVVVADSLLHNKDAAAQADFKDLEGQSAEAWAGEQFALEDEQAARDVLHRQYAAVVGNPPYITVKDKVLRDRYREMYSAAFRSYSLAVPFMQRVFQLGRARAFTGQITANSFMKREFGKKLIEEYLPTINLDLIVNTSGAYIPGHGTPTVLLFGTSEEPQSDGVLSVLAKRGEPSTPDEPENGEVWSSIAANWSTVGYENDFISIGSTQRTTLAAHPWSLAGGGATALKALIEDRAATRLGDIAEDIGKAVVTRENALFLFPHGTCHRLGIPAEYVRPALLGGDVRDWGGAPIGEALWPYDENLEPVAQSKIEQALWPWRWLLEGRTAFGKSQIERGLPWCAYSMMFKRRAVRPVVGFPLVATHNHFALLRPGLSVIDSVQVLSLPETATEDDHLALLAYLNSSTACFWMKQVFFDKGNRGEGGGTTSEAWEKFFEHDGTKLKLAPIPRMDDEQRATAITFARALLDVGERATSTGRLSQLFDEATDAGALRSALASRTREYELLVEDLRQTQEKLDWFVYTLFGLASIAAAEAPMGNVRACDRLFASRVCSGDVGERYFSLCHLPKPPVIAASAASEAHLDAINKSKELRLLEQPVFKRTFREGFRPIEATRQAIEWLLERLEARARSETTCFCAATFDAVGETVRAHFELGPARIRELLKETAVPFLSSLVFTGTGLKKHQEWLQCWALQRTGEQHQDVPPKYTSKDFKSGDFYKLRGKLDVPKERFISYPGCESDEDGEPVYGWAGWDHLQRAQALATLYQRRKTEEDWPKERLIPMLAGLYELLPWLKQWHNDKPDPTYGEKMGDFFERFIEGERNAHGLSKDDITTWRPPEKKKRMSRKKKPKPDSSRQ